MAAASQSSIVIGVLAAAMCACVGVPLVFLDDQRKRILYLAVAGSLCTVMVCVLHYVLVVRPLRAAQHAIGLCLEAVMDHNHTLSSNANAALVDLDVSVGATLRSSVEAGGGQFSPTCVFSHINGVGRHEEAACGEALRRLADNLHVGSKHCELFGLQCAMKDFVLSVAAALRLRHQQHVHQSPQSGSTVAPSPITSSTSTSVRVNRLDKRSTASTAPPPTHGQRHHALATDAGAFECD